MRATAIWPPHGFCGTCRARTQWFEAGVGEKTDLICENCGRVSAKEVKPRTEGGTHYEGYCKTCAQETLWAMRRKDFWREEKLFCCNCGNQTTPVLVRGKTEIFLAPCRVCGGETLWYEGSRPRDGMFCSSCLGEEPITFKRWLERVPTLNRPGDETRIWPDR